MPTPANSINEATTGVTGFTGTAFTGTAVSQYNVLTGAATSSTINNVAPSATSGVPLISQGAAAQPIFGTAVVAGGGTGATTLTGLVLGNGTSAMTTITYTSEGTFTPGISFGSASVGVTYAFQNGVYTQIGSCVFFQIYIGISNKGSSTGTFEITGLPVNANTGTNTRMAFTIETGVTLSVGYTTLTGAISTATKILAFQQSIASTSQALLTNTNFTAAANIQCYGFYFT